MWIVWFIYDLASKETSCNLLLAYCTPGKLRWQTWIWSMCTESITCYVAQGTSDLGKFRNGLKLRPSSIANVYKRWCVIYFIKSWSEYTERGQRLVGVTGWLDSCGTVLLDTIRLRRRLEQLSSRWWQLHWSRSRRHFGCCSGDRCRCLQRTDISDTISRTLQHTRLHLNKCITIRHFINNLQCFTYFLVLGTTFKYCWIQFMQTAFVSSFLTGHSSRPWPFPHRTQRDWRLQWAAMWP